jgi:hypothetical protein
LNKWYRAAFGSQVVFYGVGFPLWWVFGEGYLSAAVCVACLAASTWFSLKGERMA